ncbi:MAG TPA: hypothetical protein VMU61_06300 [Candidatus Aquilonibacter sp.]|nr:hypothetical protein [Candidatus Aquilonibacter sp.]
MNKKRKMVVITNTAGKVIGMHLPAAPDPASRLRGGLHAGPGQKMHEIEIEAPEKLESSKDFADFQDAVQKHLRMNKLI